MLRTALVTPEHVVTSHFFTFPIMLLNKQDVHRLLGPASVLLYEKTSSSRGLPKLEVEAPGFRIAALLSEETSGRQAPEEVNSLIWTKLFKVRHIFSQGQPLL